MTAAQAGHYQCIRLLVRRRLVDINAATNDGTTALMLLAQGGHPFAMNTLFMEAPPERVDMDAINSQGDTALRLAAMHGYYGCVRCLIDYGNLSVDEAFPRDGYTLLMVSAQHGHYDCVHMLIAKGASLDLVSHDGKTALEMAREKGHTACVELLERAARGDIQVENNANSTTTNNGTSNTNSTATGSTSTYSYQFSSTTSVFTNTTRPPNVTSTFGSAPPRAYYQYRESQQQIPVPSDAAEQLFVAARTGQLPRLLVALHRNAGINSRTQDRSTALILACAHGHPACVRTLLDRRARINAVKDDGGSALMVAAQHGQLECLQVLLERGAIIDALNHSHQTALMIAATEGYASCLRVLIHSGARLDFVDNEGSSALILAASRGHIDCLKILLDKGADLEVTNAFWQSALMLAAARGHSACVEALITKGALLDWRDTNTMAAVMHAAKGGHIESVRLLISHGARWVDVRDALGKNAKDIAEEAGHEECARLFSSSPSSLEGLGGGTIDSTENNTTTEMATDQNSTTSVEDPSTDVGGTVAIIGVTEAAERIEMPPMIQQNLIDLSSSITINDDAAMSGTSVGNSATDVLEGTEIVDLAVESDPSSSALDIESMPLPTTLDQDPDLLPTAPAEPSSTPPDFLPTAPVEPSTPSPILTTNADIVINSTTDTLPTNQITDNSTTSTTTSTSTAPIGMRQHWMVHYRDLTIGPLLGTGRTGRVYSATWRNTEVAVKVFSLSSKDLLSQYDDFLASLLPKIWAEAEMLATLRHPHVINFLGLCEDPPCIVTEKCARGSLFDTFQLAKSDPSQSRLLIWSRRLALLADAAAGMAYLHDRPSPILHRDLRSHNLLIDSAWRVKVSDLGVSRESDHVANRTNMTSAGTNAMGSSTNTSTNAVFRRSTSTGTDTAAVDPPSRWVAGEVLQTGHWTPASDVYSFGVVMWETLTWEMPWSHLSNTDLVSICIQRVLRNPLVIEQRHFYINI